MTAHVLIVDDNRINLKLTSDVLQASGFIVEKALDAEGSLTLLMRVIPDLILMDIGLPGMDGLTLTRALKADARLMAIPVIALTAFAMKGDERKAFEAGCDGYVSKPIDTRQLPRFVDEFLQRRAVGSR